MVLRVGILGGTGFYEWARGETIDVETEYGCVELTHDANRRRRIFFAARHGRHHAVPPQAVNARALVRALSAAQVDYVIAVYNVGTLDPAIKAPAWVVPHDLIDLTRRRSPTFHENRAVHVNLTDPYCPMVRRALSGTGPARSVDGGVYVATEGPRLETAAERLALRQLGGTVVGMTGAPEAALAREAGLCLGAVCFVAPGGGDATATSIQRGLARRRNTVIEWIETAIPRLLPNKTCSCASRARRADLSLNAPPA